VDAVKVCMTCKHWRNKEIPHVRSDGEREWPCSLNEHRWTTRDGSCCFWEKRHITEEE